MKRLITPIAVATIAMLLVFTVNAQENPSSDIITVQKTISTLANVEVNVNGQTYILSVPAEINIDTTVALTSAVMSASSDQVVGMWAWRITSITETKEEVEFSLFSSVVPSSENNKVVIINANVTNMADETLNPTYERIDSIKGYDDLGNAYDPVERHCGELDPSETGACAIAFDVPDNVTIIGLDITAPQRKQFLLQN